MLQLFIAEVLIGSVGVFAHEGGQDPITTVFFRCVFGSAFVLAWGIARGQLRGVFGDSALLRAAVLSGVLLVLNWVALFAGMARSSIGVATLVYHFFPFAMIVIAAVFFGERAHAADLAWTALAFVGVACAADPLKLFAGAGADYALGIALTFVAAILCGASLLLSRRISRERPLLVVLVQCLAGVAMLAPFADVGAVAHAGPHWLWLAGLGLVHSGICYVLFYSGNLFFTPDYGVGYAFCEGPLGPCRKPEDNRVLQSRPGWLTGPGHQSVFEADGRSFIAFHALRPGQGVDRPRVLHVEELFWDGDAPRSLGPAAAPAAAPDAETPGAGAQPG